MTRTGLESDQAWPIGVMMLVRPGPVMVKQTPGLPRGAGIAVGHEARALLVARQDVLDPRARQGAVHLDIVDARNAEDGIDAIGFEQADKGLAGREISGAYGCIPELAQDGRSGALEAGREPPLFTAWQATRLEPCGKQLRPLDAAAIEGERAARIEGAARRRIERRGQLALEHDALALALADRRPASPRAARAYRDAAASRRSSSRGPCSTTRPRYMTITSSAMWRTTERSWLMKR